MDMFDVVIIGGGPGGYLCAERCAQGGMKVALIEVRHLGGTCLNEGCIPTKALLNSAKIYRNATQSAVFGVTCENAAIDQKAVIAKKEAVIKTLVGGVSAAMNASKVEVFNGKGVIKGRCDGGFAVTVGDEEVQGRRLVIATGSLNIIPPISGLKEGLERGFVMTNTELLNNTRVPSHFTVIGGGVIGLEFATYYASIGTRVTVIDAAEKIAGDTPDDVCKLLYSEMGKQGVEFKTGCRVTEIGEGSVTYEESGETKVLDTELVLLCVGRKPNTENLGLETLSIETNGAAVVTDRHLCTNISGVYAIGDVNGKSMLAHTAYREAEVAANHMLGRKDEIRYEMMPYLIHTEPEYASVGLSEAEAKERGLNIKVIKLPMVYSGLYVAETDNGPGFIRVIADKDKKRMLGCAICGDKAAELITTASLMIDTELTPERLQKLCFPHPTVAEVIREALFRM